MIHQIKRLFNPLTSRLHLAVWNARGWFPWRGGRVYAPRNAHLMREVAKLGDYEPAVNQVVRVFARPGTVVVDVGANLGLVSLAVLKSNDGVTVHSYEPSNNSAGYLRKTCLESDYRDRWHVHSAACADRAGLADFHLSSLALGAFDGLAASSRVQSTSSMQVQLVRLDDEWVGWSRPDISVVKIDVEGAEARVCEGMHELISACRPVIVMEWNLVNLAANRADPLELFRIAARYSMSIFEPDTLIPVTSLQCVRLLLDRGKDTFVLLPDEAR